MVSLYERAKERIYFIGDQCDGGATEAIVYGVTYSCVEMIPLKPLVD